MSWQPPEGVNEYLKATELCDCDNAELQRKAKELVKGAETPKNAALKIFYFVRDGIPWSLDHCDTKASVTLKKRWGDCVNKTSLQVALLRATGIPARYHQGRIKREWVKRIVTRFMYNRIPEIIWFHSWCECYLTKRWVACDSIFDEALFKAMLNEDLVTREQIPSIDWDGENSLIVMKPWFIEGAGSFPSLDDVFRKAEKEIKRPRVPAQLFGRFFLALSNQHTDRLRKRK